MPAKTTRTSVRKKQVKPETLRRRKTRKQKKKTHTMPVWLRNILTVGIILVFTATFYYFFIRPYAYRWKPFYGQKEYGVFMPYGYKVHLLDISNYQGKIDWY